MSDEEISIQDVIRHYEDQLLQAYKEIVILKCRIDKRDREIEQLRTEG